MGGGFYKLDAKSPVPVSTLMMRGTLLSAVLRVATAAQAGWWPVLSND